MMERRGEKHKIFGNRINMTGDNPHNPSGLSSPNTYYEEDNFTVEKLSRYHLKKSST